jgi:hypothetical protein
MDIEKALKDLTKLVEQGFKATDRSFEATDRKFEALAADIADIRNDMATKKQVITLHEQLNAIEGDLRNVKHTKLHARVADSLRRSPRLTTSPNSPSNTPPRALQRTLPRHSSSWNSNPTTHHRVSAQRSPAALARLTIFVSTQRTNA